MILALSRSHFVKFLLINTLYFNLSHLFFLFPFLNLRLNFIYLVLQILLFILYFVQFFDKLSVLLGLTFIRLFNYFNGFYSTFLLD